ncbi:MAG: GntR family transcriptional regulator [Streptosporangiaceae bacterium]
MSPRSRASAPGSVPERTDVYERLAGELRQAIISGRYQPGDRLPSTLEIMERTGVANLTVRGAYRLLVEEGLVESIPKKGFYVRRPSVMTWRMTPARTGRGSGPASLDAWAADAEAAGLACREDITVAIEDAAVPILGIPAGERLGLPTGSRVLVRRAIRYAGPADGARPAEADSLADEYYPYDLIRDTPLASPAPASPAEALAAAGLKIRTQSDELRPRVATTEERRLLSLPQVSVVLELARTARTADGQPVVVVHQVRRGDGATYTYDITYPGR